MTPTRVGSYSLVMNGTIRGKKMTKVILTLGIVIIIGVVTLGLLLVTYTCFSNQVNVAYAHFFGISKNVDNYQIVFQPLPIVPAANENSTLNFSILDKDSANVNNVYAALAIKEKNTGKVVEQVPYKFYEFSDITFPYKFRNNTDYIATFEARINGDSKYQDNPLVSDFDVSVGNNNAYKIKIPFSQLMLYYVTPVTAAIAGISIYVFARKK
ncbi:MAG: hypothetical protein WA421_13620 [Nitrososphaeraceae archaeon]|jgi:hypothetical protein